MRLTGSSRKEGGAKLALALDLEVPADALHMAERLADAVDVIKVGPRLFVAGGPACVTQLRKMGLEIFLDLKFHDIPATVSGSIRAAAMLDVSYITIHTVGGAEMMKGAAEAAGDGGPTLLGVTVLTSTPVDDPRTVVDRALLAQENGLGGIVASARELGMLREALGSDMVIVTPGIRPEGSAVGDQVRVATPRSAVQGGADMLVVGRPILNARDPREAALAIREEIAAARQEV